MISVTVEQIRDAMQSWDQKAAADPEHFDEWDAAVANDPMVLAEWFVELLIKHGAVAT
jgi:hypothetical protein